LPDCKSRLEDRCQRDGPHIQSSPFAGGNEIINVDILLQRRYRPSYFY
jgi:hypothetical protein